MNLNHLFIINSFFCNKSSINDFKSSLNRNHFTCIREKHSHTKKISLSRKNGRTIFFEYFPFETKHSPQTTTTTTTNEDPSIQQPQLGLVGSNGAYRDDTWPIPRNPPRIHYATSLANFRRITSQRPRALRFLPPFG